MEAPTHRPIRRTSEGLGPTPDQVRRAFALARQSPSHTASPSAQQPVPPSVDFDAATQPLLDAVAESEVITTEDLAIRINTRD